VEFSAGPNPTISSGAVVSLEAGTSEADASDSEEASTAGVASARIPVSVAAADASTASVVTTASG